MIVVSLPSKISSPRLKSPYARAPVENPIGLILENPVKNSEFAQLVVIVKEQRCKAILKSSRDAPYFPEHSIG
jgi:hypothetical protein